jgi:hypothetical protein
MLSITRSCKVNARRCLQRPAGVTMACSAILVLDLKGRVLLARDYRGDIPLKQADRFIQKVQLRSRLQICPNGLHCSKSEGIGYTLSRVLCSHRFRSWRMRTG